MNKLVLPAVGLVGTLALIKYNAFKAFSKQAEVFIEALNIVPGSFDFNSVKFMLKLRIVNPTKFSIELERIVLYIYINNKLIARVVNLEPIVIKKESFSSFRNEIKLDLTKLPGNLIDIIKEGQNNNQIIVTAKGELKSFWGSLQFNQNKTIML